MEVLIIKLGATGDVVRTTPLLRRFKGPVTWVTAAKNTCLLDGLLPNLRCFSWEEREKARDRQYELVINLEDDLETGLFQKSISTRQLFGAYVDSGNALKYTDDSREWFDLSLISLHGRQKADQLKYENRRTYQEMIFKGLGLRFSDDAYLLPSPLETGLKGDVAISREAGPVWPMKNWAYYDQLQLALEWHGLTVNILPKRPTLLEHLADVRNHRCVVGGDSLPMHFALGTGTRCVSLFTCTSPWEIHDYGLLEKIISPLLGQFFYKRDFDVRATTTISVETVIQAVFRQLDVSMNVPTQPR